MNPPLSPILPKPWLDGSPKSSGMPPIVDESTQRSPALAGLNLEEPPKGSTAYAVPVDTTILRAALAPRCDGHHKNALFCRVLQSGQARQRVAATKGGQSTASQPHAEHERQNTQ